MKTFIIGDVHGCLNELKKIIKDIDRLKTRIICVGDLIDRGKNSIEVLDFIIENKIESVLGNHEYMMLEVKDIIIDILENNLDIYSTYLPYSDWWRNGGVNVFNQYLNHKSGLKKLKLHLSFIESLPLYIKTGIKNNDNLELIVSHTYCINDENINSTNDVFNFVWNRYMPNEKNKSKYFNIFGHTPVDYFNYNKKNNHIIPKPIFYDDAVNIDTGCVYDINGRGYLTGIYFPSLKYKQIKLNS